MATAWTRSLLTILFVISAARPGRGGPNDTCTAPPDVREHIRLSDCRLAQAVATGMARSATFRRLVDRIVELNGIVYVSGTYIVQPAARRVLYGALQHRVVKAGEARVLFVTVAPGRETAHIARLAHELQHAIEVLESGETTDADVDRLFERIGVETGDHVFETMAAEHVQQTVAKELAARR